MLNEVNIYIFNTDLCLMLDSGWWKQERKKSYRKNDIKNTSISKEENLEIGQA